MLLHRREAHGVVAGQLGDAFLGVDRAAHDVPAGMVRQGTEHAVEVGGCNLHETTIRLYQSGVKWADGA